MDKNLMKAAMRLFFPTLKGEAEAGDVTASSFKRTQKIFMRAFLATPRSVGRFHSRVFCLARKAKAASKAASKEDADVGDGEQDEEGGSDEDGSDEDDDDNSGEGGSDDEDDAAEDENGDDEMNTGTGVEETLAAVADVMVQLTSIMEKHMSHNPLWPCGSKAAKRLVRAVFPRPPPKEGGKGTIG
jgi:hypothetical protein